MVENVIKIGLLGCGTVGTGVVKLLKFYDHVVIKKIAVKSLDKPRSVDVKHLLTKDVMAVAKDPEISVLVETIGGTDEAYDAIVAAITSGKHVVTANKELIAKRGQELFKLARQNNVIILYEASVAGGIPIIMPVKQSLAGNRVQSIAGILNGTTNYILTKMEAEKAEFADVLDEAQKLGYAEADPTSDVEGFDAAYKIAILASMAFCYQVDVNNIFIEGITQISTIDIDYATELGYKIKLLAIAKITENNMLDIRVHPALVPTSHSLAHINGVTNAVSVCADAVGEVNFSGPGAGEMPTASSVLGDLLSIVNEINHSPDVLPSMKSDCHRVGKLVSIDDTVNSYYVRIHANDIPGVMGKMGTVCGKHGVSLSGVIQKDMIEPGIARIILLTHKVKESDMQAALREMEKEGTVREIANVIRVY